MGIGSGITDCERAQPNRASRFGKRQIFLNYTFKLNCIQLCKRGKAQQNKKEKNVQLPVGGRKFPHLLLWACRLLSIRPLLVRSKDAKGQHRPKLQSKARCHHLHRHHCFRFTSSSSSSASLSCLVLSRTKWPSRVSTSVAAPVAAHHGPPSRIVH